MIDGKLLYPIGSIYINIQDTNPSDFFGGTWERIAKGKTLVGVDENDPMFNESLITGGEKTHKLSVEEMPNHCHGFTTTGKAYDDSGDQSERLARGISNYDRLQYTKSEGGNKEHNNMPPFLTCYIFVRTA